jgi:putative transposase
MPRNPRKYQISNSSFYHIVNRGVLRQTIFHDKQDAREFVGIIKQYKTREEIEIYHWCLMGNHYHLVLKMRKPERISKLIGGIQQVYAQYYHKRYHTAGRLFGSRFKSQVIEDESYLLVCGRYVERNPVRAGLIKNPWDWSESSALYYVLGKKDAITDKNPHWADGNAEEYKQWLLKETEQEVELFHGTGTIIKSKDESSNRLIIDGRVVGHKKGKRKMPSNML